MNESAPLLTRNVHAVSRDDSENYLFTRTVVSYLDTGQVVPHPIVVVLSGCLKEAL